VTNSYGIEGKIAPHIKIDYWLDGDGKEMSNIDPFLDPNYKLIFCFQSWCPGCHSRGFPALKEFMGKLEGNKKLSFYVLQTVFEGFEQNTKEQLALAQKKYQLRIPFGQDGGKESGRSQFIDKFNSGGTPWFILIGPDNRVMFNDFGFNVDTLAGYFQNLK
jgi:thiol-disulfide isomerase/thioredoxin